MKKAFGQLYVNDKNIEQVIYFVPDMNTSVTYFSNPSISILLIQPCNTCNS